MEQWTHCSQTQKLPHVSSRCCGARCGMIIHLVFRFFLFFIFLFSKAEGWSDWSPLAVHLTQKLGRSAHLLSATIIQMAPPVHSFLLSAVWSTGCLCHRGFIIGTLAKLLSSSVAAGSLLKRGRIYLSHFYGFFYDYGSRARVIARTIKVIKGWSCSLGSFFFFFTSCVNVLVGVCQGGYVGVFRYFSTVVLWRPLGTKCLFPWWTSVNSRVKNWFTGSRITHKL